MDNNRSKVILDTQIGNITEKTSRDKAVLTGEYVNEESTFAENIQLTVTPQGGSIPVTVNIPYSGYYFKLFLGDFNGDGKSEILIRGDFGGSGGFIAAEILRYNTGKLEDIFNQEMFDEKYKFQAQYLENKKVEVISITTNEKFLIDISLRPKVYQDLIYESSGKVKEYSIATVSDINAVYPLSTIYKETYNLLVQRRIVGIANADTLGIVESYIDLTDNKINLNKMGVLTFGETPIDEQGRKKEGTSIQLPLGAILISLNDFGGKNDVIKIDIDGDKREEYLVAYILEGSPYLAVYRRYKHAIKVVDTFKGQGYTIESLSIERFRRGNSIVIGWKLLGHTRKADIISLRDDKFKIEYKNTLPSYEKMYIEDIGRSGKKEIILWNRDKEQCLDIKIYDTNGDILSLTEKYDELYYSKVVDYYNKLLETYKDSPIYLYELSLALDKIKKYDEAIRIIDKAMDLKHPYPSMKDLVKLRVKIVRLDNRK